MTVREISDATFEQEVLKSPVPVLVDFTAEWCGPCKAMAPALEQVAAELEGKVKIVKIDVDKSPNVPSDYSVRGMPTMILFRGGEPAVRHTGALVQKKTLADWIERGLATQAKPTELRVAHFKLANGMEVVVIPNATSPNVFHAVYYKAGTADDPGGAIGAAGFLPTLLLKSTEKIATGNHAEASKHLWQLQGMAFSGFTLFRHSVARDQLQGAMQAQADRMTQLHLSDEEIKATRQAMLDLFSRRERTPGSLFNERMEAEQHGRAVGSSNEPGELTRAAAVAFQERYYGPNNAVLALSGDVTLEDAKRLAEDTYGKIASRPEVARRTPIREPLHSGARRVMVKDPGARETNFKRYYTVPGYGGAMSGEAEALEVLMKIVLGRLNQRLVDTKIASKVNSEYVKIRDPGIFTLYVATDSERHEAAEAEVDAVIDEIRTIGITEAELDRARQALARAFADEKGAHTALVGRYVTALAFGRTMAQIDEGPEVLAKLTVDDIKKVAATYLDPSRSVTGWLLKAEATGDVAAA